MKSQRQTKTITKTIKPDTNIDNDSERDDNVLFANIKKKLKTLQFKNDAQKEYWELIDREYITLCMGPAGTAKTMLAIAKALDLLVTHPTQYRKIILTKPAVCAHEEIGFLPGSKEDKMAPFIYSATYLIEKIIGKRRMLKLQERGYIEVFPIAFIRGVNWENCVVVLEELQNADMKQITTLLTRIGENAKFIVTGDLDQNDRFKSFKDCGLYIMTQKLKDLEGVGIFQFEKKHIVRHPLISKILERLENEG